MRENEVILTVSIKVGDRIKIKDFREEFNEKIATVLEQISDTSYKTDLSEMPFNITMFEEGTLIRD
jgi:hypothetical protein